MEALWYNNSAYLKLLAPFAWVFGVATALRRFFYRVFPPAPSPVPVIVVGNITVGGTGKTPLLIAIAKALEEKGLRVGVISRGYKAQTQSFPKCVQPGDSANQVGDEPYLIARHIQGLVVIDPNRVRALRHLLSLAPCDIVLSDDGLQHLALPRDMEIIVMDGQRQFGNAKLLPQGPLREPLTRLRKADFLVVNQGQYEHAWPMQMVAQHLKRVQDDAPLPDGVSPKKPMAMVCGIGNPERFWQSLSELGMTGTRYTFSDHHAFTPEDLTLPESSVIMTEKDSVKCAAFATADWYYLPVRACLPEGFWGAFWQHPVVARVINP